MWRTAPILIALFALPPAAQAIAINVVFGTGGNAVPTGAQAIVNQVVGNYDAMFSNITLTGANAASTGQVNVTVDFGSTGLGQSNTNYVYVTYSTWTAALQNNQTANPSNTYAVAGYNSLPGTNPYGPSTCDSSTLAGCVVLTSANARAIGITTGQVVTGCLNPEVSCSTLGPDSVITLSNTQCYFDDTVDTPGGCGGGGYNLQNVFEHELDEALAVDSTLSGLADGAALPNNFAAEDYFRYTAITSCNGATVTVGSLCLSTTATDNVYFSYNGGAANIGQFYQGSGGDRNDWIYGSTTCGAFPPGPYVQDAYACPGTTAANIIPGGSVTPELQVLETLGYDSVTTPEPGTLALLGLGLAAILVRRKRLT
jgi:hypothetical protein